MSPFDTLCSVVAVVVIILVEYDVYKVTKFVIPCLRFPLDVFPLTFGLFLFGIFTFGLFRFALICWSFLFFIFFCIPLVDLFLFPLSFRFFFFFTICQWVR